MRILFLLVIILMCILLFENNRNNKKVHKGLVHKTENVCKEPDPSQMSRSELRGYYLDRVQIPAYVRVKYPEARYWDFVEKNQGRRWASVFVSLRLFFKDGHSTVEHIPVDEIVNWNRVGKTAPKQSSKAEVWLAKYGAWLTEQLRQAVERKDTFIWVSDHNLDQEALHQLTGLLYQYNGDRISAVNITSDNRLEIELKA